MENHINKIIEESKRKSFGDNRSRAVRNLNTIIELGVKIVVCEKGFIYTRNSGFKWNLAFQFKNKKMFFCLKERDFEAYNVLRCAGNFLKKPEVREVIKASISTPTDCGKCGGHGIIPHFLYYADGICFDCGGAGTIFNK